MKELDHLTIDEKVALMGPDIGPNARTRIERTAVDLFNKAVDDGNPLAHKDPRGQLLWALEEAVRRERGGSRYRE